MGCVVPLLTCIQCRDMESGTSAFGHSFIYIGIMISPNLVVLWNTWSKLLHCGWLINLLVIVIYCRFAGRWGDNGIMNGIKLKKLLSFVSRPRRREDVSWGECVGSSVRLQVIEGQFPRCSSSCVHHCYKSYQYIFWNKSQVFCTGNLISYSDPPTRRAQ